MSEKSKHIEDIKEAISVSDQVVLFGKSDMEQLNEACVKYLKFKGYKIVKPINRFHNVKTLDELICFFYSRLDSRHPECVNSYRSMTKDRVTAKKFVEARMNASGINKKEALNECVEIVKTLFDYESEFHFKYEMNFKMFGQDKLGWITDKAIQIINRESRFRKEDLAEKRSEEMIKAQDTSNLGFNNLQEILEKLEKKNNGKKERGKS